MHVTIKKYLVVIFGMGGVLLPDIGWCEMHPARALSQINGTESIKVEVTESEDTITLEYAVPGADFTSLEEQFPCPKGICTTTRIMVGNAEYFSEEGKPVTPKIPSIIIIPVGKEIDCIRLTRASEYDNEENFFF